MLKVARWPVLVPTLIAGALVTISACADATSVSSPPSHGVQRPAATASPQPIRYPPTTKADLKGLAAMGNPAAVHEFDSESGGLVTCPQPKREVTVDPSVTGQQLAEDLLAYFYAQQLDNPCGTLVLAYHDPSEAGNAFTAGSINVNVTDSSGASNVDPNATGLKYQLTLDIGPDGANQEFIVNY